MDKFFFTTALVYLVVGISSVCLGWVGPDELLINETTLNMRNLNPYASPAGIHPGGTYYGGAAWTPLFFYLAAPIIIPASILGANLHLQTTLSAGLMLLIDVLTIGQILAFIKFLQPRLPLSITRPITLLLFFSGFFLYTSAYFNHPESLVLLFSLLSLAHLAKSQIVSSGFFMGLAILSHQEALFIAIPLLAYITAQHPRQLYKYLLFFFSTLVIFLLPLFLTHPVNAWASIFGNKFLLRIAGPNIWWLIASLLGRISPKLHPSEFLIPISGIFLFACTIIFSILFTRQKIGFRHPRFWALLVISSLSFSLFGYWIWFRHFLMTFILLLLWDISRKNAFPAAWVTYSFLLITFSFMSLPVWQPAILLTNLCLFLYVLNSLHALSRLRRFLTRHSLLGR